MLLYNTDRENNWAFKAWKVCNHDFTIYSKFCLPPTHHNFLTTWICNCSIAVLREEIEKQKAHERYMKLQEQGKTDQAKKDLGNTF